ncbi:SoxR reducing system RseC family protein [Amphritea sp. HPY]|uniref:SoxR reducing system RseC family protein n=1 Tax=Amphritea sp. HPY TaxID=3421652 RepID=UPI003D7D2CE9
MIEETGTVVRVEPQGVWIETIKQSACSSCSAQKGCGQSLLAKVGDGKRLLIQADNPDKLRVAVDDQVVLGVGERSFLTASLTVYLLPILMMFMFALVPQLQGATEPVVIFSALAGLAIGFLFSRGLSLRLGRSCSYRPVLLRVI